jgi:hypothetical protein
MAINEQDKKRKRAVFAFQIFIYGFLLANFLVQLYLGIGRGW